MAFGDWIVGVFMQFGTNGVETMARLRAGVESVNDRIRVQNGLIDKNAALMALQRRRVEELRAAQLRAAGMAAGVGAVAGAAVLGFSVNEAAKLQSQLNLYQMQTGSSVATMARVQQQVFDTARMTAQSASNVAGQFVTIAQMNLPMRLMSPHALDQMAKFADVVNLASRGSISTDESLKIGISTAHQLGIYDAPGVLSALTAQARASLLLPHGLQRFSTQAKYYAPWVRLFGDSPQNIMSVMEMGNLIDVSGLSTGRGGTAVRAFMQKLVPSLQLTKHVQSAQIPLLRSMGLLRPDNTPTALITDRQGRTYMDPGVFTNALYEYAQRTIGNKTGEAKIKARADIVAALGGLFGAQGGLWASVLSNSGLTQLKTFHDRYAKTPKTIDQMQAQLLNTFWGSLQKATTAIDRFGAAFGTPALNNLTKILTAFANFLDPITMQMVKHPRMTGFGFVGATAATVGLGAFAVGTWVWSKIAAFKALRGIPESISELGNALKDVARPVKTVTGLVDQFGRPLARAAEEVRKIVPEIGEGGGLAGGLGRLATATSRVLGPIGLLVGLFDTIGQTISDFKTGIPLVLGGPMYGYRYMHGMNTHDAIQAGRRALGGKGFDDYRRAHSPTINLNGDLNITLPKGTPKQHAQAIIQHIAALGGSINTGPTIPGALTVGGGMAAYT